ncbi:MAG TPA: UDP-glucose/GDP-mannose dehydrogenase family protein [Spirochaetales bacterium]|nr:UDP-glucose/GDP-mannose dehydrogenase family protein [Spirochaetales bacterium]HRY53136.1 UDP-glucose/GDP-mannose dehydrogenase family protein [Spirochaetia bacterium]HRZ66002.1 UDP-glucose/GDP-mannose dehydrogenase family protein [Spirochaetia bacterium]
MSKIAVIGTGYVGLVSGACLADFGNAVSCVDVDAAKIEALRRGKIPIFEPGLDDVVSRNVAAGRLSFTTDLALAVRGSEVVFIAVGTPPADDGSADLKYVEAAAREVARAMDGYRVIVDKSTVPVGTARKVRAWVAEELVRRGAKPDFDVVSNPEFLREGSAVQDFTHPDRVVIGAESERARAAMKEVYRALYIGETPYIETGLETAEMIKYASNAFLAVKITFINEVANLCERVGADVQDVAKAMGRDGRIGPKFLHPGPGYGGSCFPKDTQAMARIGRDHGEPLSIVETTIEANERQKERMVAKIEAGLGGPGSLAGKTIAILGLAFKPNTDDMREAPAIAICEGLAARGARIRAWDPEAAKEASWRLASIKDRLEFAKDEYDAIGGSDALVLVTEWNQLRTLDLERVMSLLKSPNFFDLRNVYKRDELEARGFRYFAVGR